jgi:hypothetical protein
MLLFLFHGTEFRVVFSSAEMFGREFREIDSIFVQRNGIPERNSEGFLFRGTAGIPSEITICFVCRKFPTLSVGWMGRRRIRLSWRTMEWRGRSPSALEIGIALIFLRTSSQLKRYGEKGQRSSLNNLTVGARNKWRGSR